MDYFVSCKVRSTDQGIGAEVNDHGENVEAETAVAALSIWLVGKSFEDRAWLRCSAEELRALLDKTMGEVAEYGFETKSWEVFQFECHDDEPGIEEVFMVGAKDEFEFQISVLPTKDFGEKGFVIASISDLVERLCVIVRDDGIAFEIYEVKDSGQHMCRAFEPKPGVYPGHVLAMFSMRFNGRTLEGEPLIRLEFSDNDYLYITEHAPAIVALVLYHRRTPQAMKVEYHDWPVDGPINIAAATLECERLRHGVGRACHMLVNGNEVMLVSHDGCNIDSIYAFANEHADLGFRRFGSCPQEST